MTKMHTYRVWITADESGVDSYDRLMAVKGVREIDFEDSYDDE